jgi:hypothetical protein
MTSDDPEKSLNKNQRESRVPGWENRVNKLPLQLTYLWIKHVRKYAQPKPDDMLDVALRLEAWRVCFKRPRSTRPPFYEEELFRTAEAFDARQQAAQHRGAPKDRQFLKQIANAYKYLESPDVFSKLRKIEAKALFVFDLLQKPFGEPPTIERAIKELKKRVKKEKRVPKRVPAFSTRSESRARKALALFYGSK